jgi:methenyltetrahydromethanopterin cyclohydrolase
MTDAVALSLNRHVQPWVERLRGQAAALRVAVQRDASGVCVIDAGIAAPGGVAAGLLIGEICMAGLGQVRWQAQPQAPWPSWLHVASSQPVLACLASQYAGWSLAASQEETGGKKFFALGSGPARALACKEPLFAELGYRDRASTGVIVIEANRAPPPAVIHKLLRDCALAPEALTIVLTPTTSPAGTTQVVARVLEVALHKAHELKFDLHDIVDGSASAPLPVPSSDGLVAMGRTNDAILYGGCVHLSVRGSDAAARNLALALPAANARGHGRSFAQVFEEAGFDFYKIDPALFAPAEAWVSNLDSGRTWHAGAADLALLLRGWQET